MTTKPQSNRRTHAPLTGRTIARSAKVAVWMLAAVCAILGIAGGGSELKWNRQPRSSHLGQTALGIQRAAVPGQTCVVLGPGRDMAWRTATHETIQHNVAIPALLTLSRRPVRDGRVPVVAGRPI